jgi:asparagine synthase (glutamine-hydrolysing)
MANSLEVRVPFLDHNLVEYVAKLPSHYKLHNGRTKAILKDAFRKILPDELYTRPKHGFEVPLLKWFQHELRSYLEHDILSDEFITEQGIFKRESIQSLKKNLFSNEPGDVQAQVWRLIVFQHWWKNYMM